MTNGNTFWTKHFSADEQSKVFMQLGEICVPKFNESEL